MQEKGKPPHLFTRKIGRGTKKKTNQKTPQKKQHKNQQPNKKPTKQTTQEPGACSFASASHDQKLFSSSARKLIYISVL